MDPPWRGVKNGVFCHISITKGQNSKIQNVNDAQKFAWFFSNKFLDQNFFSIFPEFFSTKITPKFMFFENNLKLKTNIDKRKKGSCTFTRQIWPWNRNPNLFDHFGCGGGPPSPLKIASFWHFSHHISLAMHGSRKVRFS